MMANHNETAVNGESHIHVVLFLMKKTTHIHLLNVLYTYTQCHVSFTTELKMPFADPDATSTAQHSLVTNISLTER